MDKIFDKVQEAINNDDVYTGSAILDVTIVGNNSTIEVEHAKELDIKYRIELEHRDWGVKDISVAITEPIEIEYTIDDESKTITIEPEKIDYDWETGSGIGIQDFNVVIENDKIVKAEAIFSYWTPFGR